MEQQFPQTNPPFIDRSVIVFVIQLVKCKISLPLSPLHDKKTVVNKAGKIFHHFSELAGRGICPVSQEAAMHGKLQSRKNIPINITQHKHSHSICSNRTLLATTRIVIFYSRLLLTIPYFQKCRGRRKNKETRLD